MKKIIVIGISIVVFILFLLFLYFQTYSVYEIDADNYRKKLKQSDNSIWDCMLDDYIPDNISLWSYGDDYQVVQPTNVKVNIEENKTIKRKRVTITQTPSNLNYIVTYQYKGGDIKVPIWCMISNSSFQYDPRLVNIAEQLVLNRQFIFKKSQLINGQDILIKETDNDFIIIEMFRKYDYNDPPMHMVISTYSKKRFF
jgi:hypothetical protein